MTAYLLRYWLTLTRLAVLPVMVWELYRATAGVDSLGDTWDVIGLSMGCVLLALGDTDEMP